MIAQASIVIPTYNHAAYVAEAIESAVAQTVPCEVIVVDDGSTDDTAALLARLWKTTPIRVLTLTHGGPSVARNAGLEAARAEFVMFLDADDVIAPTKIAAQIAASEDVGWVLCDVRIEDPARGRVENASERYGYAERDLGGWIRSQLAVSNFIPIMAPLVRRAVLGEAVRFGEERPEDWHFWYAVAAQARVRYLPQVLATYRKRRIGRNREGIPDVVPINGALLLNLGGGTPGTRSWFPMPGCIHLDRSMGWMFEDGLPQYAAGSVDGITISHALMYVDERDWARVFEECARVLKPGGVLRVTEDATDDPSSTRVNGWRGSEPAITLTSTRKVRAALERVGLRVCAQARDTSQRPDGALNQAWHGDPPDVFFLEGVK